MDKYVAWSSTWTYNLDMQHGQDEHAISDMDIEHGDAEVEYRMDMQNGPAALTSSTDIRGVVRDRCAG
jgi:hypothetical protein